MKKSIEYQKTISTKEELLNISFQDIVLETIPNELENWDNECDINISISVSSYRYTEGDKRRIMELKNLLSSSNKLTTFFRSLSAMVSSRKILMNKELKITEQKQVTVKLSGKNTETKTFDKPTKVLFIDLTEVYNKYRESVGDKDALSQSSLISYFESNKAFLGLCKTTQFEWIEQRYSPTDGVLDLPNTSAQLKNEKHVKNTSAYMFNYCILKELIDITL